MRILVADHNAVDRAQARGELERLGHQVVTAADGDEASVLLAQQRPDVVIAAWQLYGRSPFAALPVAPQKAPAWQPVLFLSGSAGDRHQAEALNSAADGYLKKPLSAEALDTRLRLIARLVGRHHQAEDRARELEKYQAGEEEEKRIVEHLIARMVNADKLNDPAVRHWIESAALSGSDLVAAARTPANTLHVLLADGAGHGLAASVSVLPIIAPFYRMTEKGFGIDAIVREMNAKIRELLPLNRFVAVTLAAVDFREEYVRVWNGGNPSPLMQASDTRAEHLFELRHLPLGVLADEEFEATTETRAFTDGTQLILYSDGLIEAENAAGTPFGFARLAQALGSVAADAKFAAAVDAVRKHVRAGPPCDDISLVAVSCRHEVSANPAQPQAGSAAVTDNGAWRFGLHLGAAELRRLDVVPILLELVNQFDGARERSGELFVVISELFNNALDHGLLRLDSCRKLEPDGMTRYLEERQERLLALDSGEIEIEIEQLGLDDRVWLRIVCRDSGPGFSNGDLRPELPASDLPFGRGLALVRHLSVSFEHNDIGNTATAIVALQPAATAGGGV